MWTTIAAILYLGCPLGIAGADTTWMRSNLETYFSKTRHHVSGIYNKLKAKEFIVDEFTSYGLDVVKQQFDTALSNVKGINVIGILKGRNFGQEIDILSGIGAHYDTMRDTPGVDDNGAGMVAMLQAAKKLSAEKRENTVIFAAFDFEEWEKDVSEIACAEVACGSTAMIDIWLPDFLIESYGQTTAEKGLPVFFGALIMDTVMNFEDFVFAQDLPTGFDQIFPNVAASIYSDLSKGDFITVIGRRDDSALATLFSLSWHDAGKPEYELEKLTLPISGAITEQEETQYRDYASSDHVVLWRKGYSAVFITDTANYRGSMKQCYHKECDDFAKVDDNKIAFLGKLTDTLTSITDKVSPLVSSNTGNRSHAVLGKLGPLLASVAALFLTSLF